MASVAPANSVSPAPVHQAFLQMPPQPYVAPGLSFPDNSAKFLGVFTASHLSICLLVSGFGLIVMGLVGVVTRASLNGNAFYAVGIALIIFGTFLIVIAISVFVFAVRWGRKKVNVLDRPNQPNYTNIPISILPIGFQMPGLSSPNQQNQPANNPFDNIQPTFNGTNNTNSQQAINNQQFYGLPVYNHGYPVGHYQTAHQQQPHYVLVAPTAPPQTPISNS